MVYITTEVAKTVVILLCGFTTLPPRTHLTLENQRVSFIFFLREAPPTPSVLCLVHDFFTTKLIFFLVCVAPSTRGYTKQKKNSLVVKNRALDTIQREYLLGVACFLHPKTPLGF